MALPAIINNPFALIVSKQKIVNNFAWELNISSLPQDPLYLSRRVRRWLFACSLEYLDLCVVGVAERLQQLSKYCLKRIFFFLRLAHHHPKVLVIAQLVTVCHTRYTR